MHRRADALAHIGHELKTSPDTVDSWRRGLRCIPEVQVQPLVKCLGFGLPTGELSHDGLRLLREVERARRIVGPYPSWRERVKSGSIVLRVGDAEYGDSAKFWRRCIDLFLNSAGIEYASTNGKRYFDEIENDVWKGALDVGVGLLSTPRNNIRLCFFNSPIAYRVNCVVLRDTVERVGGARTIRQALAHPQAARRLLLPIAMPGEIGDAYAKRTLGFASVTSVRGLDASAFCDALNARSAASGPGAIAIIDEITCFSVLKKLKGAGHLVFPLAPDPDDVKAPLLPSFALGLCVGRNDRLRNAMKSELREFISEALGEFIHGNASAVARFYVHLYYKVRRLVDEAVPQSSYDERRQWAARTFRLNEQAEGWPLETRHWRAVLREVTSSAPEQTYLNKVGRLRPVGVAARKV